VSGLFDRLMLADIAQHLKQRTSGTDTKEPFGVSGNGCSPKSGGKPASNNWVVW
jgi:hypothetical protein